MRARIRFPPPYSSLLRCFPGLEGCRGARGPSLCRLLAPPAPAARSSEPASPGRLFPRAWRCTSRAGGVHRALGGARWASSKAGIFLLSLLWWPCRRAGPPPDPSGCGGRWGQGSSSLWRLAVAPVPAQRPSPQALPWVVGLVLTGVSGSRPVPPAQPARPPPEEPGRLHHPVLHALHPPGRHVLGLLLD